MTAWVGSIMTKFLKFKMKDAAGTDVLISGGLRDVKIKHSFIGHSNIV